MDFVSFTSTKATHTTPAATSRLNRSLPSRKCTPQTECDRVSTEVPISLQAGLASEKGTVKFGWKTKGSANSYFVEYAPMSEAPIQWRRIGRTPDTQVQLRGLSPGADYWFRVVASK